MASLRDALYEELSGHAGLTALVGTRIYPILAPASGSLPRVTFQKVISSPQKGFGGDNNFKRSTVQIDSWASTSSGVEAVANQVRLALDNTRGVLGDNLTEVRGIFLIDERDSAEFAEGMSSRGTFRILQEYEIWHEEDAT